jgi:hypothetical protein
MAVFRYFYGEKLKSAILSLCLFLVITLLSCAVSLAETTTGGRIDVDTIWTLSGSPYIVTSTIQVYGTATDLVTLTIEPGVEVRFNNYVALNVGYNSNRGALIAKGTPENPIVFTRNDSRYSWGPVTFDKGSDDELSLLEYVNIQSGAGPVMESTSLTPILFWKMSQLATVLHTAST